MRVAIIYQVTDIFLQTTIPTSMVGRITRPTWLIEARKSFSQEEVTKEELDNLSDIWAELTIREPEKTGLDEISDGEQRRKSFFDYLTEAGDGFEAQKIPLQFGAETYPEAGVVRKIEWTKSVALKELIFSKRVTKNVSRCRSRRLPDCCAFSPRKESKDIIATRYLEDAINLHRFEYQTLFD
jgi:methionine synthase II (cobalamin-independent)